MSTNKVYWKSLAQLEKDNKLVQKLEQNEFVDKIPVDNFFVDDKTMGESTLIEGIFLNTLDLALPQLV